MDSFVRNEINKDEFHVNYLGYNMKFFKYPDYLYLIIESPEVKPATALAVWIKIADICSELRYHKLLIAEKSIASDDIIEEFDFDIFLLQLGFHDMRLAHVNLDLDKLPDVGIAGGIANNDTFVGKSFSSLEEAKSWLLVN